MVVGTSSRICRAGVQTVYWRFVAGNPERMVKIVKTLMPRETIKCPTAVVESSSETVQVKRK